MNPHDAWPFLASATLLIIGAGMAGATQDRFKDELKTRFTTPMRNPYEQPDAIAHVAGWAIDLTQFGTGGAAPVIGLLLLHSKITSGALVVAGVVLASVVLGAILHWRNSDPWTYGNGALRVRVRGHDMHLVRTRLRFVTPVTQALVALNVAAAAVALILSAFADG